jgi:hypothetical protein
MDIRDCNNIYFSPILILDGHILLTVITQTMIDQNMLMIIFFCENDNAYIQTSDNLLDNNNEYNYNVSQQKIPQLAHTINPP